MSFSKIAKTTVHAVLHDGRSVVRDSGTDKWFISNLVDGTTTEVTLQDAVSVAMDGSVKFDVAGGEAFDTLVRHSLELRTGAS